MKILNLALLTPFLYLLIRLFVFEDINDPIKYIYTLSGVSATVILFASICISMIKEKLNLMKYRKTVGLYGFFYTFLHFLNFIVLDAQVDLQFVIEETLDKPFIYLGMIAFIIVLLMAITSTKKLFKKFNKYHQFIYVSLLLITIHWIMAQKSLNLYQFLYLGLCVLIAISKFRQKILNK